MGKLEDKRLELHEKLCGILGSNNVYFQPPESIRMRYPAIRYERDINNVHADNSVYKQDYRYTITFIHRDPDNDIIEKLSMMPTCRVDRAYVADNLYHNVFTIF